VSRLADPPDGVTPNRLVFDPGGHLWAVDPYKDRFAEFAHDGRFLGYWGQSGSANGEFDLRRNNGDGYGSIAFAPDGSIYVLDVGNRRVQKFDSHRRFLRSWGGFGDTPGKYDDPIGIDVGADGTVCVLDDVRGVLEEYDPNGKVTKSIAVFENIGGAKFNGANGFAIDAKGNIYVSQIEPNQVAEFDPPGTLVRTFGVEGPFQFSDQPGWIVVDDRGRVFVDQDAGRAEAPGVVVFAPDGTYLGGFGVPGDGNGDVRWPTGIAIDGKGTLFLGDAGVSPESGHGWIDRFRLLPPLSP
jgi:sugar lactone lactonase YvrE